MAGKGDTPRPVSVPKAELDANWERTFGRKDDDEWTGGYLVFCTRAGCTAPPNSTECDKCKAPLGIAKRNSE